MASKVWFVNLMEVYRILTDSDTIKAKIKAYILEEFLPGENPDALEDSTPLITGGILDSIATIKLISFLEETWGVSFEAFEISVDYLNTLDMIAEITKSKMAQEPFM